MSFVRYAICAVVVLVATACSTDSPVVDSPVVEPAASGSTGAGAAADVMFPDLYSDPGLDRSDFIDQFDDVSGTATVLNPGVAVIGAGTELSDGPVAWEPSGDMVMSIQQSIATDAALTWVTSEHAQIYRGYVDEAGEQAVAVHFISGATFDESNPSDVLKELIFAQSVFGGGEAIGWAHFTADGDRTGSGHNGQS